MGTTLAVFRIAGIGCCGGSLASLLMRELCRLDGVHDVNVNHITGKLYVAYDPARVSPDKLREAVRKLGLRAFETHL